MARPSAGRSNAGKPKPIPEPVDPVDEQDAQAEAADEGELTRSKQTDKFWDKAKMQPIEIALPGGVGYTLRAYRLNTEITPTDYTAREDDEFPDRSRLMPGADFEEFDDEDEDDFDEDDLDDEASDDEADLDEEDDEDDEDDEDLPAEEVPLFLSQGGHLLLFKSRSGLVNFVASDAEHDLAQLDGWESLSQEIKPEHIVPLDEDTYELDLVVKNLRSGHESWDPDLIAQSGQIARDLGHALRIEAVVMAMAPGSPLDDLDEALRAVAEGGMGTFFARRKVKKIGTETASIGWRTVIGKISAVVDWRD